MSFAIEVASEAVVISYRYPVSSLQLNIIEEGEVVAGKTAFGDFTGVVNLASIAKLQYIASRIYLLCQIRQFGGIFDKDRGVWGGTVTGLGGAGRSGVFNGSDSIVGPGGVIKEVVRLAGCLPGYQGAGIAAVGVAFFQAWEFAVRPFPGCCPFVVIGRLF